jgi:hypothetical protein
MGNFLRKLAAGILTGTKAFIGLAPILSAIEPRYAPQISAASTDLSALGDLVVNTEVAAANLQANGTTLTGEQKMQLFLPLVYQYVTTSNLVAGKKIADPAELQAGAALIAQGIFSVVNALHEDTVSTVTTAVAKT